MNYTKPQVTNTKKASVVVMSTQQKDSAGFDNAFLTTNPAYGADE